MDLYRDRIDSPLGPLWVVTEGEHLCALAFSEGEHQMLQSLQARYRTITFKSTQNPLGVSDRIRAYLAGDFDPVLEISVNPGGTVFQQQVWSALRAIPVGTTCTYGALATQLGNPKASRAVGMANARNPIAIVIPCHRVVGANATLTGYAGGLDRKRWLLHHEGVDGVSKSGSLVGH
jgi:methylated-DNA-[protein]-cysteine S-methyltransferase